MFENTEYCIDQITLLRKHNINAEDYDVDGKIVALSVKFYLTNDKNAQVVTYAQDDFEIPNHTRVEFYIPAQRVTGILHFLARSWAYMEIDAVNADVFFPTALQEFHEEAYLYMHSLDVKSFREPAEMSISDDGEGIYLTCKGEKVGYYGRTIGGSLRYYDKEKKPWWYPRPPEEWPMEFVIW